MEILQEVWAYFPVYRAPSQANGTPIGNLALKRLETVFWITSEEFPSLLTGWIGGGLS